jgi:hypothetical protein
MQPSELLAIAPLDGAEIRANWENINQSDDKAGNIFDGITFVLAAEEPEKPNL